MTKSILIVEDNETERTGLTGLLQQEGYAVETAHGGQQGVASLRERLPNLVLLDMMMPNGDGWYFLENRNAHPDWIDVPVLVMTGLTIASETWAEGIGAVGLLRKPINSTELMQKVKRHITD